MTWLNPLSRFRNLGLKAIVANNGRTKFVFCLMKQKSYLVVYYITHIENVETQKRKAVKNRMNMIYTLC